MSPTLRYTLYGIGGFFLLLLLLVGAVFLIPVDVYRGQIETAAEEATGRKLTIGGDLSLTIYPTLGITAEQVAFANAPGRPAQMAVIDNLVVGVELMPLLGGDLRVTQLVLDKPVINLEVDKSGKPNWQFDAIKPPPDQQAAPQAGGEAVKSLSLGDVRIIDGTVIYTDLKSSSSSKLEKVNATVTLPSLDEPLTLDGDLVFKGETLDINSVIKRPRAFMDGGKTQLTFVLDSAVVDSNFDGAFTTKSGAINGHLDLAADSVRRLAAWAGSPLSNGGGFGPLKVKGVFAVAGNDISFRNAAVAFDGMNGTGDIAVNTAGRVPMIKATAALDRLDLNTYMTHGAASSDAATAPAAAPINANAGWSDQPIDASGLKGINADLNLTVGELLVQKIKMGKSALALKLNNGVLTADLRELALYEGAGKGTFVLDGSKALPTIRSVMTLDAIKALPLLTDAAQMSWLEGIGTMTLDVTGTGRSQAAIMRSLSGKGSLKFIDGAIKGVNLAQIARTLQSVVTGAALGGNLYGEGAKTDFAELGGTFTIVNGVLTNQDLRLLNPLVRMSGKGLIDIGQQTIKYRVEPKAVGSLEGQGGQADVSGLGVPFLVTGPWSRLSFEPDLTGLVQGTIQDVLSGKGVQIPGLPGIGGSSGDGTQQTKPEDLLQDIFGNKKKKPAQPPASAPAPSPAPSQSEVAPVESAPIQSAPPPSAPAETAPADAAPAENAPVESAPAESPPSEAQPAPKGPGFGKTQPETPAEPEPQPTPPSP